MPQFQEWLVVLIRSLIAFATLFLFARILGKQQISELTFFEYVLGITVGSTAASLSTDLTTKPFPHWLSLLVWTAGALGLQMVQIKNRRWAKIIDGEPVVLIQNGKILEKNLKTSRMTVDELLEQLRLKDVFDLSHVEFAILETNGQVSVLRKSQHVPVTPYHLNIPTSYEGLSTELIVNGKILPQNLEQVQLDENWLRGELARRGLKPEDCFLATLNTKGELYVSTFADRIPVMADISDYPGPN